MLNNEIKTELLDCLKQNEQHVLVDRKIINELVCDPNELLTLCEVAGFLKVTTRTVYRLVKKGYLKEYRVGTLIRFKKEEIKEFFKC